MKLREKFRNGLDWLTVTWITVIHLMCLILCAWYFFTWKGLLLFVFLGTLFGFGVTLGYHRYFTHGSFKTYRPVEWLLACIGQLSGEGSLLHWVATHRKHHLFSDDEGDPHSPLTFRGAMGFLWAHILWMMPKMSPEDRQSLHAQYAADLFARPLFRFLDATYLVWHLVFGAAIFFTGWGVWDLFTGTSFLVWGMFVRMTFVLHSTWLVNSATHLWGYQNYRTRDHSKNLWWVALLSLGEGWHNNHHRVPKAANHGVRWYELVLDPTYHLIRVMGWLGLAWDIKKNKLSPTI